MWHVLNEDAKGEAREAMKEAYKDRTAAGGMRGRQYFDDNNTTASHERNMAWEHAKRVLGDSHAIFNTFNNKGKKTKVSAAHASLKAIKALADVMKLTRWRQEPECANLLYLTDEQRAEVIAALDSLHTKLQIWSKAQRKSFEANQLQTASSPCVL